MKWRETGAQVARTWLFGLWGDAYWKAGQPQAGLAVVDDALAIAETIGERVYEAELWRLKGELLLAQARQGENGAKRKGQKGKTRKG